MNDVKVTGKLLTWHCVVLVCTMMGVTAAAQENDKVAASNLLTPKVVSVSGRLEIGQTITVAVSGLQQWSAENDPRRLVPFLNGRALQGLYPEELNLSGGRLQFHLLRTPESQAVWEELFEDPVLRRPVTLSVGLENQSPLDTVFDYDHRLSLTVIPATWGVVSLSLILIGLALLIYLARNTNILRHSGPSSNPGKLRPYDVGRVQTAFWFFLISSSYLGLWLITGDLDTLTRPVLGLIGISSCTALAAHLMRKPSVTMASVSAGFLADILSGDNGYSLLNFQMLAWSFALGIIFVASVYTDLTMPKFNGSLLALTGISSATYLGFKFLEQQNRSKALLSLES